MDKQTAIEFLRLVGADLDTVREDGDWLRVRCPLARITHQNGDKNPSCGILCETGRSSAYYCFGCSEGKLKPLSWIVHVLWVFTGKYNHAAAKMVIDDECGDSGSFGKTSEVGFEKRKKPNPLPIEVLRKYPLLSQTKTGLADAIRNYMAGVRGFSVEQIVKHNIRHNPVTGTIVFPLTDTNGATYVLQERKVREKEMWTVNARVADVWGIEYPTVSKVGCWMNIRNVNWGKPVMLVESGFDSGRIASLGFENVIASGGTGVTKAQLSALSGHTYILGYDADRAGAMAEQRITGFLRGKCELLKVGWSVVGIKDGGELKSGNDLRKVFKKYRRIS